MDETRIITLMSFDNVGEAEIYHALLESAGIRSVVQNDFIAGILPAGEGGMLRINLNINQQDEAEARRVLAAKFDKEDFDEQTHKKGTKPQ